MRHRQFPADRHDVRDVPLASTLHQRNGRLHRVVRGPEVDIHRVVEILVGLFLERPDLYDSGVIYKHVDPAEARANVIDELLRLLGHHQVAFHGEHVAAAVDQFLFRSSKLALVAGTDRDPGSEVHEPPRHHQPEAAGASRDRDRPPRELVPTSTRLVQPHRDPRSRAQHQSVQNFPIHNVIVQYRFAGGCVTSNTVRGIFACNIC